MREKRGIRTLLSFFLDFGGEIVILHWNFKSKHLLISYIIY